MATNNAINNSAENLIVENLDFTGSTISTISTNANLILAPNGTGLVSIASAFTLPRVDGTSGQVLKTNGSGTASWQSESATNFTWNVTTSSTAVTLAVNNGYIANNTSARVVYTLPSSFAVGDIIEVCALAGNGFRISQNASQFMVVGNSITTIGTGGYIESQNIGDWVQLLGVSSNSAMMVEIKVGNITQI
jgi:hypothetical protein